MAPDAIVPAVQKISRNTGPEQKQEEHVSPSGSPRSVRDLFGRGARHWWIKQGDLAGAPQP
jgi:hypothetical protein